MTGTITLPLIHTKYTLNLFVLETRGVAARHLILYIKKRLNVVDRAAHSWHY